MISRLVVIAAVFAALTQTGCTTTRTEPQYAGASIFPPLQTPDRQTPVRLGRGSILWGDHDVVYGADTSFIGNIVNKEFVGSALSGVFHSTSGKANITGGQFSGLMNLNYGKTRIEGLQFTIGVNYARGDQRVIGIQFAALANLGMKNRIYGFQFGLYNEAEAIYGFQVGLVNKTKKLYGLQIGLANISYKNGLPFCPIINAGF